MTTERVQFRLLQMPCCTTLVCWVNPRLPSNCVECGKHIYPQIKSNVFISDMNAVLKYDDGQKEPT